MAQPKRHYACNQCGSVFPRWMGKCDACGEWNTITEETIASPLKTSFTAGNTPQLYTLQSSAHNTLKRFTSGVGEFDRILGGGFVPGGVTLLGGDPGIGKSTLLLQIAALVSGDHEALYISGEEGIEQIQHRASRLDVAEAPLKLASSTSVEECAALLKGQKGLKLAIIDSVQTMALKSLPAAPGTVSQIREASHVLIQTAKQHGIALILVGHVTKEGVLAGPRLLEHMVDTVLYFEGEKGHVFRLLRAHKNRFGACDELGVFEMTEKGLSPVQNPSNIFLERREEGAVGTCVFPGMEGTQPLLVEIQALVAPSFLQMPRRSVLGWDAGRLAMILAVLETRCRFQFAQKDIYLNVVGGIRINEPAADLAVAAALISCVKNKPLPPALVAFGEISLSGEIRPTGHSLKRLQEASKLGFECALLPNNNKNASKKSDLKLVPLAHIHTVVDWVLNASS